LAIAFYFVLLGYDSVTRLRYFSPDSKYYVEAARYIVNGEGISYSTADWKQALAYERVDVPRPMTIWMPLYPILIATGMKLGLPGADAALLLSLFSGAMIVWLIYLLARRVHDENLAVLAAGYVAASGVMFHIGVRAWSETTGIAFLGLAFLLTVLDRREGARKYWIPIAAGAAACGAFYARYALLPMAGFVALMFIEGRDWRATLRNWVLFTATYVLLALPALVRNYLVTGIVLGATRDPSNKGLLVNIGTIYASYVTSLLPSFMIPPLVQWVLATLFILTLLVMLAFPAKRARFMACVRRGFVSGQAHVFTVWALGYIVYIVLYRTKTHFDPLDARIGSPGFIPLAVPVLAFLTCRFSLGPRVQRRLSATLISLAIVMAIGIMAFNPHIDDRQKVTSASEVKSWILNETTPRDLVIGDDLTDITFVDPERTVALLYLTDSEPDQISAEQFFEVVKRQCGQYERVFLTLSNFRLRPMYPRSKNEEEARASFHRRALRTRGVFLTDLIEGRLERYPGIHFIKEVKDGYLFRVDCPM
jgi:4-amino-4-deoxy-L-arabinose transferase-like glycosyltransferase